MSILPGERVAERAKGLAVAPLAQAVAEAVIQEVTEETLGDLGLVDFQVAPQPGPLRSVDDFTGRRSRT
jgi:hypothetical protein